MEGKIFVPRPILHRAWSLYFYFRCNSVLGILWRTYQSKNSRVWLMFYVIDKGNIYMRYYAKRSPFSIGLELARS